MEVQVPTLRDPESAGRSAPNVLLVEDDPGVRDARRMLLEAEGYRVEAVASAQAALEAVRRAGSFEVLITDDLLAADSLPEHLGGSLKGVLVTECLPGADAALKCRVALRVAGDPLCAEELLLPLRELLSASDTAPAGPREHPDSPQEPNTSAPCVVTDAAALIVHDLRSALAVISNVLETCGAEALAARVPNATEILSRQLRKIARMTDDLLEVRGRTRMQTALRCEPVSLTRVIIDAIQDLDPQLRRREQSLALELPGDAIRVRGDAVRLGQVVTNILENASKYSGAGDLICVSLRRIGPLAEVRVRDRGIGIRGEDLPLIFMPYFRSRGPQSNAREGSGLGLAVARRLVELHGGTIEATSAGPGEGSEFTVRLTALPEPPQGSTTA